MLRERWTQLTTRDDAMMIEQALQTEPMIAFTQIEGRWFAKVSVCLQGTRVGNYYFEVLDNEHLNMLNSVNGQVLRRWQQAAAEQLQAASTMVPQPDGGL